MFPYDVGYDYEKVLWIQTYLTHLEREYTISECVFNANRAVGEFRKFFDVQHPC